MRVFGKTITWAVFLTFTGTAITLGFLTRIGEDIYDSLKTYDFKQLSELGQVVVKFFTTTIEVQLINVLLVVIAAVPFYRLIKRYIVGKLISEVIFIEDFSSNTYFWALNYWGSTNRTKTNRIENHQMIFEALPTEWTWSGNPGQNGAYYDLRTGIVDGLDYSVECKVKSSPSTTMKFQLWVHDAVDRNSVRGELDTPPTDDYKIYKVKFKGTDSHAMRIHLHCVAGQGQIIVDEVKVVRRK